MKTKATMHFLLLAALFISLSPLLSGQSFINPVPIPYLMPGNSFSMDIQTAIHNFDPNGSRSDINLNVPLEAYCYNETGNTGMSYLGPTLIFQKGAPLDFDITNNLPPTVNTTVHWHGLNIPAEMDGGPHQVIVNDSNWTPNFTVIDPVQTIWYHTHLMNETTDQVVRGLAGLIIIEDENDPFLSMLPHDYGQNDFPIVIQEKGFILDSMTTPPTATAIKAGEKPGNGPYTLINGIVGGVLHVPPEMVRLRILNGSPRKMFHIGLSTNLNGPSTYATMWMFATGGGYLEVPLPIDSTLMSIGDRREFLVDFSQWNDGDTIYMRNLPVPKDAKYGNTLGDALMAFVVDDALFPPNPITSIPTSLVPYELAPGQVFKTRVKNLMGSGGSGNTWMINGTPMNLQVINDTVLVNTKERWVINNTTNQAHPFHIHKVQFQVVEYEGQLGVNDTTGVYTYPNLPDELIGYKDVQLIRAGATMTFEARFDSFPGPLDFKEGFMYHCHILTHEDTSMMHQFVVVDSLDFFATGISVPQKSKPLFGYPNPAVHSISFKDGIDKSGILSFYDLFGKTIHVEEILSLSDAKIDVHQFPRGVVLVEFVTNDTRYVQKIILQDEP